MKRKIGQTKGDMMTERKCAFTLQVCNDGEVTITKNSFSTTKKIKICFCHPDFDGLEASTFLNSLMEGEIILLSLVDQKPKEMM